MVFCNVRTQLLIFEWWSLTGIHFLRGGNATERGKMLIMDSVQSADDVVELSKSPQNDPISLDQAAGSRLRAF